MTKDAKEKVLIVEQAVAGLSSIAYQLSAVHDQPVSRVLIEMAELEQKLRAYARHLREEG